MKLDTLISHLRSYLLSHGNLEVRIENSMVLDGPDYSDPQLMLSKDSKALIIFVGEAEEE